MVNTGTRVPGFKNKVMVDIEQMMSYAHGLRTSAPAEVMEAQEVIRQKESIINQANLEARRIKATASQEAAAVKQAAQVEYLSKVDEAEIIKAAETKVGEMEDEAHQEAQRITHRAQEKAYRMANELEKQAAKKREGADQYAQEVLSQLEEELSNALGQIRRGMDRLSQDMADRTVAAA